MSGKENTTDELISKLLTNQDAILNSIDVERAELLGVEHNPKNPLPYVEAQTILGVYRYNQGLYNKALEHAEDANAANNGELANSPYPKILLGLLYWNGDQKGNKKKLVESLKYFEQAERLGRAPEGLVNLLKKEIETAKKEGRDTCLLIWDKNESFYPCFENQEYTKNLGQAEASRSSDELSPTPAGQQNQSDDGTWIDVMLDEWKKMPFSGRAEWLTVGSMVFSGTLLQLWGMFPSQIATVAHVSYPLALGLHLMLAVVLLADFMENLYGYVKQNEDDISGLTVLIKGLKLLPAFALVAGTLIVPGPILFFASLAALPAIFLLNIVETLVKHFSTEDSDNTLTNPLMQNLALQGIAFLGSVSLLIASLMIIGLITAPFVFIPALTLIGASLIIGAGLKSLFVPSTQAGDEESEDKVLVSQNPAALLPDSLPRGKAGSSEPAAVVNTETFNL